MSEAYTGVKVLYETPKDIIDTLYKEGSLAIEEFDGRLKLKEHQNLYLVLTDKIVDEDGKELSHTTASAIARVYGDRIIKIPVTKDSLIGGVRPRNKEQAMALDALTDDRIKAVTLTGPAGTGKTLLTLAAAMHARESNKYDRIILTRPMTQVTKHDLGILPGEVDEKFGPYLQNYMCNMEFLMKGGKDKSKNGSGVLAWIEHYKMEFIPMQLIRGASWPDTFIIADEVQTLNYHEMLTLGTRVGENSKIVIMGDLAQRDIRIAKPDTGLWKFSNAEKAKKSQLVAHIELLKCERSDISRLFAEVFDD
jgi:PhoH-like ATPase